MSLTLLHGKSHKSSSIRQDLRGKVIQMSVAHKLHTHKDKYSHNYEKYKSKLEKRRKRHLKMSLWCTLQSNLAKWWATKWTRLGLMTLVIEISTAQGDLHYIIQLTVRNMSDKKLSLITTPSNGSFKLKLYKCTPLKYNQVMFMPNGHSSTLNYDHLQVNTLN